MITNTNETQFPPALFWSEEEAGFPELPGAAALFSPELPVWEGLSRMKTLLDEHQYNSLPAGLGGDGPLAEPIVLYHPGWVDGQTTVYRPKLLRPATLPAGECSIDYADPTKGKLRVCYKGELLAGASVLMAGAVLQGKKIEIAPGVLVESGAFLKEPLIVGANSEIRQGAYLRGYCLVGRRCVVGHVSELKNCILMNDAKAGHFAYLGDSILGPRVNLGAGTKLANLRFAPGTVRVKYPGGSVDSGRRKFGAVLGADCQTGCNSVSNPGSVLAKGCLVLPNSTIPSGYHPAKTVIGLPDK